MATPCAKCGNLLEDTAKFCGGCGAVVEPKAGPAPQERPASAARTMLGFQAIPAPPATVPIVPPAPSDTTPMQPLPEAAPSAATMLGIPSPLGGAQAAAPPVAPHAPAPAAPGPATAKTMIGVAAPGIAPVQPAPLPALTPQPAPSGSKTMLGVAAPGIAPVRSASVAAATPIALPPIVPAPAPLVDEPLPPPPPKVSKKGVPIVAVVAILALVLAVGGSLIALFMRSTPIVASPQLSADGKEQLRLTCESCRDGWTVRWDDRTATFANGEANLDTPRPLAVGENDVTLVLDKGGSTREVRLAVDVDFRVQPVLDELGAPKPQLKIAVQIQRGDSVTVDGAPLAVEDKGAGAGQALWTSDLGALALGPSDETKTLERTVPYVVTVDGKPKSGTVSFRVPIAPLRVDAPGASAVVEGGSLVVTGRAAKGARVQVGAVPAEVHPDGTFEAKADVPPGESEVLVTSAYVKGDAPALATRTIKIAVKRVEKLEAEASAFEKAHPLGWDALAGKLADNVGQPMVVTGSVLEARTANRQTILVVDVDRGCAKGPCIARVIYGGDTAFARGDYVRAFGRITRPVQTSDGKAVPEVEAAFALKGRRT
jgi:hypothetical protein